MDSIDAEASGLAFEIGRFDIDGWRDVVPDVRGAADSIRSEVDDLQTMLGELSDLIN